MFDFNDLHYTLDNVLSKEHHGIILKSPNYKPDRHYFMMYNHYGKKLFGCVYSIKTKQFNVGRSDYRATSSATQKFEIVSNDYDIARFVGYLKRVRQDYPITLGVLDYFLEKNPHYN